MPLIGNRDHDRIEILGVEQTPVVVGERGSSAGSLFEKGVGLIEMA